MDYYVGRPAMVIRRHGSHISKMIGKLFLDKKPEKSAQLFLRVMDCEKEQNTNIVIRINGKTIFQGVLNVDLTALDSIIHTLKDL